MRLLQSLDSQVEGKIRDGVLGNHEKDVNLHHLIGRVKRRVRVSTISPRDSIVASNKLPTISGDEALIFTVFRNLISNGLKYKQPGKDAKVWVFPRTEGGPRGEFWASELMSMYNTEFQKLLNREDDREAIARRRNNIQIAVLDNGIGIMPNVIGRIFRPLNRGAQGFAEIPTNLSDIYDKGLGVGLTAAQWAMKMHGGDITVSSKPGLGSIFVVAFPRERLYISR